MANIEHNNSDTFHEDSLKFERRVATRMPANGSAVAAYTDHQGRNGIAHIELIDRSDSGLGLMANTLIEPGMTIVISSGNLSTPGTTGTVACCEARDDGYRIGLRVQAQRMAA